jgi:hypothetical protein
MMSKGMIGNLFNRLANRWSNSNQNHGQNHGQTRGRLLRRIVAPAVALAALLAIAGWVITKNAPNATARAASFISIKLKFEIGKRTPQGKCGPGFGVCDITLSVGFSARSNTAIVSATPLDERRLECLFEANPPSRDRLLEIAEDKILDEPSARKFGFKSMTILRGSYAFDSSKGKFGGVILNMRTTK